VDTLAIAALELAAILDIVGRVAIQVILAFQVSVVIQGAEYQGIVDTLALVAILDILEKVAILVTVVQEYLVTLDIQEVVFQVTVATVGREYRAIVVIQEAEYLVSVVIRVREFLVTLDIVEVELVVTLDIQEVVFQAIVATVVTPVQE
jgi:hypothetical protein